MVNVSEKCCKFSISISPTARGKYQFIFLSLECRHCVVHMLLEGALQDGGIDGAVTQFATVQKIRSSLAEWHIGSLGSES
jgi:hypothetical protein